MKTTIDDWLLRYKICISIYKYEHLLSIFRYYQLYGTIIVYYIPTIISTIMDSC